MAIDHTFFFFKGREKPIEDSTQRLNEITTQINEYLYNFAQSPFFQMIGRSYFQKCLKSWVMVSSHLEKFLNHPRANYSLLMVILDHEMLKFPSHSFYCKQLRALAQLIATGPELQDKPKNRI